MSAADRGRRRGRVAGLLALAAGGLAAALVAFEVVVRVFFPMSDFLWDWDPVIGMKLKPGRRGRSILPGVYDVAVEVNSAGFRDREHAIAKPPGTKRVVLLGDSFLEAVQVPFEDSVAAALERLLDDPALRERMSVAGRERAVREFSYDVLARRLGISLGALAE